MELPVNQRVLQTPNKPSHIIKQIPTGGKILVHQNEEIKPSDIIGKYHQVGGFRSANLSQQLHVHPSEVSKYLKREIGKTIYQGELLAVKNGFFRKKEVQSPTDAVIQSLDEKTGIMVLRLLPKELPVLSGVYGIVDLIDAQTGNIYIKTMVTNIYGVLGSGKQREGILHVIGSQKSIILEDQIPTDIHQAIILGGSLFYIEALRKALENGASGIISGGINARDFKSIVGAANFHQGYGNDAGISLLIQQGYGGLPINNEVYQAMWLYEGKFIFIDGNSRKVMLPSNDPDSILKLRSVMLPIVQNAAHPDQPDLTTVTLKEGDQVRIIWPPFMGAVGKVLSIDSSLTSLPSGVSTYMVTLELAGQKIKVPYSNIEVVI